MFVMRFIIAKDIRSILMLACNTGMLSMLKTESMRMKLMMVRGVKISCRSCVSSMSTSDAIGSINTIRHSDAVSFCLGSSILLVFLLPMSNRTYGRNVSCDSWKYSSRHFIFASICNVGNIRKEINFILCEIVIFLIFRKIVGFINVPAPVWERFE